MRYEISTYLFTHYLPQIHNIVRIFWKEHSSVLQQSGHSFCPMAVISKCPHMLRWIDLAHSIYRCLYHWHKCRSCILNAFSECQRGSKCLCLCWPLLLKAGAGNCFCRSVPGCNWGTDMCTRSPSLFWQDSIKSGPLQSAPLRCHFPLNGMSY